MLPVAYGAHEYKQFKFPKFEALNSKLMHIICRDIFGKQALFEWWHGKGGLIDYTNKEALEWWHSQMDKVV